jgi:hypothetical protein
MLLMLRFDLHTSSSHEVISISFVKRFRLTVTSDGGIMNQASGARPIFGELNRK